MPEIAENFIHRVGRTGRAGGHGVASTLYVKEQRSELFQLERTLGIRMERMKAEEGSPNTPIQGQENIGRIEASRKFTMVRLPGEILQAQMDS
jgi:superfamily II DNA/RNA helicase